MSVNILLISDDVLIDRTAIHGNIDPKMLYPDIKAAQDQYILAIIGTALFEKIQADILAGTLTGIYKLLVDNYVIDCLMNYVLMELPSTLSFQLFNKGAVKSGGDGLETASFSEVVSMADRYKRRAEFYAERLKLYLIEESSKGNFPEFINPGSRADTVFPYGNTFSLPIFLGREKRCKDNGGGSREYISNCEPNY